MCPWVCQVFGVGLRQSTIRIKALRNRFKHCGLGTSPTMATSGTVDTWAHAKEEGVGIGGQGATEVLGLSFISEDDVLGSASDREGIAPCSAKPSVLSDRESVAKIAWWSAATRTDSSSSSLGAWGRGCCRGSMDGWGRNNGGRAGCTDDGAMSPLRRS